MTEADSGIGQATAECFAVEGARIVCADIAPASARETAKMITDNAGQALAVSTDVTDPGQDQLPVSGLHGQVLNQRQLRRL